MNLCASGVGFTAVVPSAMSLADAFAPYARAFLDASGFRLPPERSIPANNPFAREYDSISAVSCASVPALAAPRIANVSVKPMEKGTEVLISVTIERPTPLDLTCAVSIDPGDGNRGPTLAWDVAERRTKTTRYEYRKAGTYKMKVTGGGNDPCNGSRDVQVTVGGVKPTVAASKPGCPDGWELASSKGAAFTCRVKNPTLSCAGGTKYFAGKGEVGCK